MNIGKFMMFCKQTHLFDPKIIRKQRMMDNFIKISLGKHLIEFEQFEQLIKMLDDYYILEKKKVEKLEQFPSYEARLCLNSGKKFKELINDVDLPFYVRDKEGRQLQQYSIKSPKQQSRKKSSSKGGRDEDSSSIISRSARYSLDMKSIMSKNQEYLNKLQSKMK